MKHTQQFEMMEKLASPRWAKMLGTLSKSNKNRLAQFLPANVSKRVGPEIGRGAEGRVYPSFSGGGIGDSVTKVFNNSPAFTAQGLPKPSLGRITSGDSGVLQTLGGMSISDRVKLMRKYPDIFPTIHNQHARGYTMERLAPIPSSSAHPGVRDFIRNETQVLRTNQAKLEKYQRMMDYASPKPQGLIDRLRGVPAPQPSREYLDYQRQIKQLQNRIASSRFDIKNMWKQRNEGMASPAHPIMRLSKDLKRLTGAHAQTTPITHGTRSRAPFLDLDGTPVRITDFGSTAATNSNRTAMHNVMKTQGGRAVISDPVPSVMPTPRKPVSLGSPWGYLSNSKQAPTTSNLAVTSPL